MKCVYCSKCGTRLAISRKALPKYGRIIDIVEHHECPDESVEFDLSPIEVPTFNVTIKEDKNEFVQKLNKLQSPSTGTDDLGDRREAKDIKAETSSTAPRTLLKGIKSMHNSTPANDMRDGPEE